jgi:hypothetical protein
MKTKHIRRQNNRTRKNNISRKTDESEVDLRRQSRSNLDSLFFPVEKTPSILSIGQLRSLRKDIDAFFISLQPDIKDLVPPVIYNDFAKRTPGRYEIVPPSALAKRIRKCLMRSRVFREYREQIRKAIGPGCKEELCLLPVEPGASEGKWHRDVFYYHAKKAPYYVTQLIYLDAKSDTSIKGFGHVDAEPGSGLVFDGRYMHKGCKNDSASMRYAIYISYTAPWYVDEESLIPESFM